MEWNVDGEWINLSDVFHSWQSSKDFVWIPSVHGEQKKVIIIVMIWAGKINLSVAIETQFSRGCWLLAGTLTNECFKGGVK